MANAPTSATLSRRPVRAVLIIGVGLAVGLLAVVILVAVRPGSGEMRDLAARVATHERADRGIVMIDLDAAREAAGVPADADPADLWAGGADPAGDGATAVQRFRTAALAIPHLRHPAEGEAVASIDTGLISAAAATLTGTLAVVRTSQDIEQIAAAFEAVGYHRDGNALSYPGDELPLTGGHVYAHLAWRDGLLALSTDPRDHVDVVRTALTADLEDSGLASFAADLMDDSGAPGVLVAGIPDDAEAAACVSRVGVADRLTGEAEYVLVGDDPTTVEVVLGDQGHRGRYQYTDPEVDDDRIRVGIEVRDATFSPLLIWPETSYDAVWTCADR